MTSIPLYTSDGQTETLQLWLSDCWGNSHPVMKKPTRKPRKRAMIIANSIHGFANCQKFKSAVTLTLDWVKVISACTIPVGLQHAQQCDCSVTHYRNMAIWVSWNIDIRGTLNCCDSFRKRKFENQAPTSCRSGPILSPPTASFELHASGGGDRRRNVQLWAIVRSSNAQWPWLDLDPGSGQGHVNIHSTSRTTSLPNHVTVASRTTGEIWPFEFREILTFGKVCTVVITFLEGNSKTGLRQAVVQVPYYHHQPSVLSSTQKRQRA